jgi:hypothetical protein
MDHFVDHFIALFGEQFLVQNRGNEYVCIRYFYRLFGYESFAVIHYAKDKKRFVAQWRDSKKDTAARVCAAA